jgi:predicted phage-related endonuclease
MAHQGMESAQIEERLGRIWRTKERLKDLVPSLVGRRLIDDDASLWNRFCWADDIRNKLIHAARDLDHDKAERAISACRDVGAWLDSIM